MSTTHNPILLERERCMRTAYFQDCEGVVLVLVVSNGEGLVKQMSIYYHIYYKHARFSVSRVS